MMGTLRHPNIVQFLGLWFSESGSPAVDTLYLVMEKMLTNLHDVLVSKPTIPFGLKCSLLQDIASGIAFLHRQTPPVIHQDLSARNVLLNSAMVAKIADMGMARILPARINAIMTKQPGASIYMPPEALEDKPIYDSSIDIFSLGVLALFVLAQEFPCDLKAPTYSYGVKATLVARTELERRESYTHKIYNLFSRNHPLIRLIESCLENSPKARPSINQAINLVNQAMVEVKEESTYLQFNKLQLLHTIQHNKDIFQQEKKKCDALREKVDKLSVLRDEVAHLKQENTRLQQEVARALQDMQAMQRDIKDAPSHTLFSASNTVKKAECVSNGSGFSSPTSSVSATIPGTASNDPFIATSVRKDAPLRDYGWLVCKDEQNSKEKVPESVHTEGKESVRRRSVQWSRAKGIVNLMIRRSISATSLLSTWSSTQETTVDSGVTIRPDPESPEMVPSGDKVEPLSNESMNTVTPTLTSPISGGKSKPHERIQTWLTYMDRDHASELLKDCKKGTFLARPTTQQTTLSSGGLHTHSIDVVCDGIQHVRVLQHNGKYGITMPCTFISLKELVLHFSEHSLSVHNTALSATLQFPFFSI